MLQTLRNILFILLPYQKFYGAVVLFLILISVLFETLSIAMVIPIISVFSMETVDYQNNYVKFLSYFISDISLYKIVISTIALLVIVFTLKVIYLTFFQWALSTYSFNLRAITSKRLFSNYLRKDYNFHLNSNSSHLIKNCLEEVRVFVDNCLMQAFIFLTEITVVIGISIFICIIYPYEFIIAATIFIILFFIFYQSLASLSKKFGQQRMHHDTLRIQHLNQGLVGVKDVKVFGKEDYFINSYGFNAIQGANFEKKIYFFQNSPKYVIEYIGIICISLLVISSNQDNNFSEFISILGLFAAAAFRILPSLNRIISTVVSIRYSLPVIDLLKKEFEDEELNSNKIDKYAHISFKNKIVLHDISFKYDSRSSSVLDKINLEIAHGQTIGIVGHSGSGKTTLVDIILGLLQPNSGSIKIDEDILQASNIKSWQKLIGYVPQTVNLIDGSIKENIALGLSEEEINFENLLQAIKDSQLEFLIDNLPDGIDTHIGESGSKMSGGQKQRIGIARALYSKPELLIFDESTNSLDSETEINFMDAVYNLKGMKTIIIISHRTSTLNKCNFIYSLENSTIQQL